MAWDFSTEPEFQEQLDWMRRLVKEEIWPLETVLDELGWEGLLRAIADPGAAFGARSFYGAVRACGEGGCGR